MSTNGETKLVTCVTLAAMTIPVKLLIGDWCRQQISDGKEPDMDAILDGPVQVFLTQYSEMLAGKFQESVLKDLPESDLPQEDILLEAWSNHGLNWLRNHFKG